MYFRFRRKSDAVQSVTVQAVGRPTPRRSAIRARQMIERIAESETNETAMSEEEKTVPPTKKKHTDLDFKPKPSIGKMKGSRARASSKLGKAVMQEDQGQDEFDYIFRMNCSKDEDEKSDREEEKELQMMIQQCEPGSREHKRAIASLEAFQARKRELEDIEREFEELGREYMAVTKAYAKYEFENDLCAVDVEDGTPGTPGPECETNSAAAATDTNGRAHAEKLLQRRTQCRELLRKNFFRMRVWCLGY